MAISKLDSKVYIEKQKIPGETKVTVMLKENKTGVVTIITCPQDLQYPLSKPFATGLRTKENHQGFKMKRRAVDLHTHSQMALDKGTKTMPV